MQPSKKVVITVTRKSVKCESAHDLAHDRYSAFLQMEMFLNCMGVGKAVGTNTNRENVTSQVY